jgi:hypothetical protein
VYALRCLCPISWPHAHATAAFVINCSGAGPYFFVFLLSQHSGMEEFGGLPLAIVFAIFIIEPRLGVASCKMFSFYSS